MAARDATTGERVAIGLLHADLLFTGAADGGEQILESVPEVNLNRAFLPSAPAATVASDVGKLTQPRLVTAIGYITSHAVWKEECVVLGRMRAGALEGV